MSKSDSLSAFPTGPVCTLDSLFFPRFCFAGGLLPMMLTYSHDAQLQGQNLYRQGDYADAAGKAFLQFWCVRIPRIIRDTTGSE